MAELGCKHLQWGYGQADYWQERSLQNQRDNLKETKNVSHGRRTGGTANGNATIKINIKNCEEENETSLSHFVAPSGQTTWIS